MRKIRRGVIPGNWPGIMNAYRYWLNIKTPQKKRAMVNVGSNQCTYGTMNV
jgi:hypothetical protein